MAGALHLFVGPEAEVESNGDQVGDVVGSGVRGDDCDGNDGVNDSQGDELFFSDGGILEHIILELTCEALIKPGVCLRVD